MDNRRLTSRTTVNKQIPTKEVTQNNKRKLPVSIENSKVVKRSAFGDITNKGNVTSQAVSRAAKKTGKVSSSSETSNLLSSRESTLSSQSSIGSTSSLKSRNHGQISTVKVSTVCQLTTSVPVKQESSADNETTLSLDIKQSDIVEENSSAPVAPGVAASQVTSESGQRILNWTDVDKENLKDIFHSPEYAVEIFAYYKSREEECLVDDYMARQSEVTPAMRAVLVDWMVEVQENFELNHETLYLAVRLVDHYLMRRVVTKEALQLIGAVAIFIGCKFDERIPPLVDDFLYICDDAYNRTEFVRMEKDVLRTVNFNLGMPISYSFLRRYAKVSRRSMQVLTLARYIEETALVSYRIVRYKESLIAAGCLRLAMKMMEPEETWSDNLIHYTSYEEHELVDMVKLLNDIMHSRAPSLKTVDNKYAHTVFFEVAKLPLVPTENLFPHSTLV